MRDILPDISRWTGPVAVATVVSTWGSAPRQVGAKLAMTPDNALTGSVSGGCIEGAVFEEGMLVLADGRPRLLKYGVADETAFEAVGLACGGSIEVFVEPLTAQLLAFWRQAAERDGVSTTVTIVDGALELVGCKLLLSDDGSVAMNCADERYNAVAPELLSLGRIAQREGRTGRVTLAAGGVAFVETFLPVPQLVLIGAVHIALTLTTLAHALGFQVVVVDPRAAFGNNTRFPMADGRTRLIAAYPAQAFEQLHITGATAIVTLTHDSKFDDPALALALVSPAFYVGALGGRVTREKRRERLFKKGLTVAEVDRLRAPVGLEIGAISPEEIALATLAQIVAARNGKG